MKKFKVLKNFIHEGVIYNAGGAFQTRSQKTAESLAEQELIGQWEEAPAPTKPGETSPEEVK